MGARQLGLGESGLKIPEWEAIPEECRREVVEILTRMLRDALAEEVGDE